MRLMIIMIVVGGMLCYWGYQEWALANVAGHEPRTITAEQLVQNGPGKNAHVVVTDFVLGENFVASQFKNSSTWTDVWVPVIPLNDELVDPDNVRLIIKASGIKDEQALQKFGARPSFQGMVINEIDSIGSEEEKLLKKEYPKTDFSKCWIVEVDRKPASSGKIFGLLGAGVALIVVGIVIPLAARSGNKRSLPDD